MDDFFGPKKNLDESYLRDLLETHTPVKKEIGNLLTVLPPNKDFKNLYSKIIRDHLGFIMQRQ